MLDLIENKPYLWKSEIYGNVAVHFTGLSPNGTVANFTIDGGEASTPAQRFPELSDGKYFALVSEMHKRPARTPRKVSVPGTKVNAIADPAMQERINKPRRRARVAKNNGEVQF